MAFNINSYLPDWKLQNLGSSLRMCLASPLVVRQFLHQTHTYRYQIQSCLIKAWISNECRSTTVVSSITKSTACCSTHKNPTWTTHKTNILHALFHKFPLDIANSKVYWYLISKKLLTSIYFYSFHFHLLDFFLIAQDLKRGPYSVILSKTEYNLD